MIKLYRYGYIGIMEVEETEADSETNRFWIIRGCKRAKISDRYPEDDWHRTPEAAIHAYIKSQEKRRNSLLQRAQQCQEKIDTASDSLRELEV